MFQPRNSVPHSASNNPQCRPRFQGRVQPHDAPQSIVGIRGRCNVCDHESPEHVFASSDAIICALVLDSYPLSLQLPEEHAASSDDDCLHHPSSAGYSCRCAIRDGWRDLRLSRRNSRHRGLTAAGSDRCTSDTRCHIRRHAANIAAAQLRGRRSCSQRCNRR